MPKKGQRKAALGLIAFAAIAVITVSMFVFQDLDLSQNTILTPPQNLYVQPQDDAHVIGNEYYGSFWVFNVAVTANDDIAGVILPKDTQGTVTYEGTVQALKTGAKIEIKIDPGEPYLIRTIQEKNIAAAPAATGNGKTADALNVRYYDWGEPSWRVYTPFTVKVYKDGALVGTREFNSLGASTIQTIQTSEGPVRIEMPGILGNNYLSPSFPAQVAILKGYPNVYDWTQILNLVNGVNAGSGSGNSATNYAAYWYGTSRDSSNRACNPTVTIGGTLGNIYAPSRYGGWSGSDAGGKAEPVRPVIGQSDKASLPADERNYYSLTEFIEQAKGIQNLATTLLNTRAAGNTGSIWQKAEFVTDSNGQTALKLTVPWSAYGTPIVNIRVPTELADTWIDRPPVTQTEVSAVWESTGTKYCDIYGANRIAVTLTNKGTTTGSAKIYASTTNSKLSVLPTDPVTVNNLQPNVPQTIYFSATNLGVESESADIPITIIAYEAYANTETGRDTVYATLKATLNEGTTTVHLTAYEKGTSKPIAGLPMTWQYSNQAPSLFTDSNGQITLTLSNPQGGAYTGQLVVASQAYTSTADTEYRAATATYNLASATTYDFIYEVERADTPPQKYEIDWILIALIATVIVVIVTIVAAFWYMLGKKKRKPRR